MVYVWLFLEFLGKVDNLMVRIFNILKDGIEDINK